MGIAPVKAIPDPRKDPACVPGGADLQKEETYAKGMFPIPFYILAPTLPGGTAGNRHFFFEDLLSIGEGRVTEARRRFFRILGRTLFFLGLAGYVGAIATNGYRRAPSLNAFRADLRPHWITYRDGRRDFQIDYLSRWEVVHPMERWTERAVGPLKASDRVAFRFHDPFSFASVVVYRSPGARSEEDWFRLARTVPELASSFGENDTKARPVLLPNKLRALDVSAEGPMRERTFRFRSFFVPRGQTAYRVTVGADVRDWGRAETTLETMLLSFRAPAAP